MGVHRLDRKDPSFSWRKIHNLNINQGEKDFVIERHKARGLGVSDKTTQWPGLDLTRGLGSEAM